MKQLLAAALLLFSVSLSADPLIFEIILSKGYQEKAD